MMWSMISREGIEFGVLVVLFLSLEDLFERVFLSWFLVYLFLFEDLS